MQVYGPSAWWWEVEELLRKLLLSAVVVLIESGSPLQVCDVPGNHQRFRHCVALIAAQMPDCPLV